MGIEVGEGEGRWVGARVQLSGMGGFGSGAGDVRVGDNNVNCFP